MVGARVSMTEEAATSISGLLLCCMSGVLLFGNGTHICEELELLLFIALVPLKWGFALEGIGWGSTRLSGMIAPVLLITLRPVPGCRFPVLHGVPSYAPTVGHVIVEEGLRVHVEACAGGILCDVLDCGLPER
jgi:hypothetical protein